MSDFEQEIDKMANFICDNICQKIEGKTEDEAWDICTACGLASHVCNLLNQYNKINDFDKSQAAGLMKKGAGIVMCQECKYLSVEAGKKRCINVRGLRYANEHCDGCSRGRKK